MTHFSVWKHIWYPFGHGLEAELQRVQPEKGCNLKNKLSLSGRVLPCPLSNLCTKLLTCLPLPPAICLGSVICSCCQLRQVRLRRGLWNPMFTHWDFFFASQKGVYFIYCLWHKPLKSEGWTGPKGQLLILTYCSVLPPRGIFSHWCDKVGTGCEGEFLWLDSHMIE
jgi:hypothetical protein